MKIKKVSFFFVILCWLYSSAYGQGITGEVIDKATNVPVIGANVSVSGTTGGAITDMAGKFSINLPGGANQLQVTFIGYQKQVISVQPGGSYKIFLEPDVTMIDEVVVVGYGTQKRANLTGSVSTIDTKVLEARPIADEGRGLHGTMPGLSVVVPSG